MRPLIIISVALLASCRPPICSCRPEIDILADTSLSPADKAFLIQGERELQLMDSVIKKKCPNFSIVRTF